MGLFKLCDSDPLMDLLRDTFHANPIKIPEERYQPLIAIAKTKRAEKFLGGAIGLFTNKTPYTGQPMESVMADVSATKTSSVDFDLGFEILDGFLKGMGVSGATIKAKFNGVTKVSFSFQDVKRKYIDIIDLGNFLIGKQFDPASPVCAQFLNRESICTVIDSTINSKKFTMNIEETSDASFKLDTPEIKQIIDKAQVGVSASSASNTQISFDGTKPLAFAFSAIKLRLDDDNKISFAPPEPSRLFLTTEVEESIGEIKHTPDRLMFYSQNGLLEIEA
jgi:hypothetical protein